MTQTIRAEVVLKMDTLPAGKVEQDGVYLSLPASEEGKLKYRIRLNPKSWRKVCAAVEASANPYVLIIKGKLAPTADDLVVTDAGIQFVEKVPKED
jgi:hypothetical protein